MTDTDVKALRSEASAAAKAGDAPTALAALHLLWEADRGPGAATLINRTCRQLAVPPIRRASVAVLRSFTVEPVLPLLEAIGRLNGVEIEIRTGDYGAYAQEILDPGSALYAETTDMAILAIEARDLLPGTMAGDDGGASRQEEVDHAISLMHTLVATFRQRSDAAIVVHGLDVPVCPVAGILDSQDGAGQIAAIETVNRAWQEICGRTTDAYFLDYRSLVARTGQTRWYDEKKWQSMRLPVAAGCLAELAEEWARFVFPCAGRTAKVLVLDMDNVLWGGEIGEAGPDGIVLGEDGAGKAYLDVHRAALALRKSGIVLAACSKNTEEIALAALNGHPNGLLRQDDFAALQINWTPKPGNAAAIAAALNVGIDSLVFVDDQPAERAAMRLAHPEITTIELPETADGYAARILRHPVFARLSLSAEDADRARYYADDAGRQALAQSAGTTEDFLKSLSMSASLVADPSDAVARIAQMTQKTNQFNLTTRRYSEAEIEAMIADPACRIVAMAVSDRFGDQGIVALGILSADGEAAEIDTLLMSCRVIGRGVETALLSVLGDAARETGCARLQGRFIATAKNGPVADFYSRHGFQAVEEDRDGSTWAAPLSAFPVDWPAWIARGGDRAAA